ncbi:XRE family transcriptional regulator [Herbiconiux moechotypicola]|uniref:XRE family transcriptional regulator n=1 Tax=Herbiconiux moechotypicola TaxID=637393 RepID=A0ABN3DAX3_9MICO|nr:XRE family transcriptional regulator [Herbiconiux moechotypicola]MCS5728965.1 XRE family transcriptional regulator [Herbiconiux moechotypicola]
MAEIDAGAADSELASDLGRRISALRKLHGLTLVRLAAMTELSQPFLSQIERGKARPSMASLHRIAQALGTSTPVLLAASSESPEPDSRAQAEIDTELVSLVRADEGSMAVQDTGQAKALVAGDRAMYPLEFVTRLTEFEEYYQHPHPEFIYVISGVLEVDLADQGIHVLQASDTLYFAGGVRHRWRVRGLWPARLLMTQAGTPHQYPAHEN